jgi:hypothetical protein
LGWINEYRDHNAAGAAAGLLHQRHMAFVQRAHGRHQRNAAAPVKKFHGAA